MNPTLANWANRVPQMYAAALFLAYILLILVHVTPPPLGDFADWVYQGDLLARHLHGIPDTAHTLKHYPVPNSTATVLLGLLMAAMPWAAAAKAFLCLQLVISWCAIGALARAANTPTSIWLIASSGIFLNVNFWFGLIAFQLGIAFLFFFVADLLRKQDQGHFLWQAVLLVLLFFTHMVPFTFACVALMCKAMLTRSVRPLLTTAPAAVLLAWYAFARWQSGNPDAQAVPKLPFETIRFYAAYKCNTVLKSFGFINPSDLHGHSLSLALLGRGGFMLLLLANALACGAALALMAQGLRRSWMRVFQDRTQNVAQDGATAVGMAVLLCLPVYLLLPRAMLGLSDPGSRVLQVALYVGLFLCVRPNRIGMLLTGASILMAAAGLFLFTKVAFLTNPVAAASTLPGPVQRLAMVPYANVAGYYISLDNGDFQTGVFPTGLFTDVGARR